MMFNCLCGTTLYPFDYSKEIYCPSCNKLYIIMEIDNNGYKKKVAVLAIPIW